MAPMASVLQARAGRPAASVTNPSSVMATAGEALTRRGQRSFMNGIRASRELPAMISAPAAEASVRAGASSGQPSKKAGRRVTSEVRMRGTRGARSKPLPPFPPLLSPPSFLGAAAGAAGAGTREPKSSDAGMPIESRPAGLA